MPGERQPASHPIARASGGKGRGRQLRQATDKKKKRSSSRWKKRPSSPPCAAGHHIALQQRLGLRDLQLPGSAWEKGGYHARLQDLRCASAIARRGPEPLLRLKQGSIRIAKFDQGDDAHRHHHRIDCRQRNAGQREVPEGHQGCRARSRGDAVCQLHQRRGGSLSSQRQLDPRTTSGAWRVAKDFPGCRPGSEISGRHHHY